MTEMTITVVVCDEVRTEISGKHILVGVYPSDIVPPEYPAVLNLTAWVRIYPAPAAGGHVFRCVLRAGDTEGVIDGGFDIAQGVPDVGIALALPRLPIQVVADTKLEVLFSIDAAEPAVVFQMPIHAPLR